MLDSKCPFHDLDTITTCNWCGTPICEQCLIDSSGKKLCPKCRGKLNKDFTPMTHSRRKKRSDWGRPPEEKVENRDPELTDEKIERIRKQLKLEDDEKEKKRKLRRFY